MCVCQTFSFCFFLLFFSFSSTFYFLVSTLSLSLFRCLNLYFHCLNLYDVWKWTVESSKTKLVLLQTRSIGVDKGNQTFRTRETTKLSFIMDSDSLYPCSKNIAWEFGFNLLFFYLFILRG